MLKKIGFPVMALLGVLAFAPRDANAAVRFNFVVGRPAYTYPVDPCVPRVVVPAPVYAPGYVGRAVVRHEIRRDIARDVRYHRDWDRDHDRDHDRDDHYRR